MKRFFTIIVFLSIPFCLSNLRAEDKPKIGYKNAKLSISDSSTGFKLDISNRYFLDAGGFITLGDFHKLRRDDNEVKMLGDLNFLRLRTTFQGRFDNHWGYKFQIDYGKARLKYLCMQFDYYINKNNYFRLGNMKVPAPMSANTPAGSNMMITTPLGLSLASDRRMGLTYYHTTPRVYYALGLYTYNMNDLIHTRLYGVPEWLVGSRLGYNFIYEENQKLFAGVSGNFTRPQDGVLTMDFYGGNETSMTCHKFLRKLIPEAHFSYNFGAELAYKKNRFLSYVEVLGTGVRSHRLEKDPLFMGWSATASYVVLGQPRDYKVSMGDFSGTTPYTPDSKGLEIGARVSGLSLTSGEVNGGKGTSYSLFASYWINRHMSFMGQIAYIDHNPYALGDNFYTTSDSSFRGADFLALQLRTIVNF